MDSCIEIRLVGVKSNDLQAAAQDMADLVRTRLDTDAGCHLDLVVQARSVWLGHHGPWLPSARDAAYDYEVAVGAFSRRQAKAYPGAVVPQPAQHLSKCVGGNWYLYNVNGFLGRIGKREAEKIRTDANDAWRAVQAAKLRGDQ